MNRKIIRPDSIGQAHRVIYQMQKRIEELENGDMGFRGFTNIVEKWLRHYPSDIFDGSSGDAGPVFICAVRKAIEALPEPPE